MSLDRRGRKLDLYLRHRMALIDYATPIVGDRMLAEDVVQDAWLRFADARAEDAGSQLILRPVGYLYRIVRNLSVDRSRRQAAEKWTNDADLALIPGKDAPADQTIEGRETLTALQTVLAELPERERIAFEMHRLHGMTYAQIGVALKISQTRTYELVRLALEHCTARLMDEGHL